MLSNITAFFSETDPRIQGIGRWVGPGTGLTKKTTAPTGNTKHGRLARSLHTNLNDACQSIPTYNWHSFFVNENTAFTVLNVRTKNFAKSK
jgi:hypothetical protein